MSALKTQVGGQHYKSMPIQPMEYSMKNGLNACQHTAIKYVTRYRDKDTPYQNLQKAIHTIELLMEIEGITKETPNGTSQNPIALASGESVISYDVIKPLHRGVKGEYRTEAVALNEFFVNPNNQTFPAMYGGLVEDGSDAF